MTIQLHYFAILRDQRGLAEEQLEIEPQTAIQLYQSLKSKYGLSLDSQALRLSVNQAFVPWQTQLKDGDEVVFIPPVAGG